jgi:long-chain fatty acid transport protein
MLRNLRMRSASRSHGLVAAAGLLCALSAAAPAFAQDVDDELSPPNVRLSIAQGSGARALGMGGAFTARPDDATAASWNPAGLSYLRRLEVSAAGLVTSAHTAGCQDRPCDAKMPGEIANEDDLEALTADFVSAAVPFEGDDISGAYQISFQRAIPIGGRRKIGRSRDRTIDLDTQGGFDVITAGLGIQVSRKLRLGSTLNRWINGYHATFVRTSPEEIPSRQEREQDLSLRGWNMHFGAIWTPIADFNLGLVAKTPVDARARLLRRRIDFDLDPAIFPPEKSAVRDDVVVRLPGAVGFGASWRVSNPLTASVDYTRSFWSRAYVQNYFNLTALGRVEVFDEQLAYPDLTTETNQEDTEQIRAGLEYVFLVGELKLPLRVGYFNDRQYFRTDDPDVEGGDDAPAPRYKAFTAGTGIATGKFLFDVAYVHERGRYFDGFHRKTTSNRVVVSVIFRYAGLY